MINSLFILSTGGCIVIEKHWKGKLPRSVADEFFGEYVLTAAAPKDVLPVITAGKYTYLHVLHCDLIFLAVLTGEAPVMMILEILQNIIDTLDQYLDDVTEDSIRDNFVITYELLEEMLDNGFPMSFELSLLKDLVPPPSLTKLLDRLRPGDAQTTTPVTALDNSAIPWRKHGIKYANNEIFFDVIESLHTVIDRDGKVLVADVEGRVECNSRLSGMPDLLITFGNGEVIDDCHFHPCVDQRRFEASRDLQFIPPDGNFTLMGYTAANPAGGAYQAPFYVQPQISFSDGGGRVSIMVGLARGGKFSKSDEAEITDMKLTIPLPSTVDSCTIDAQPGNAMYDFTSKEIVWEIGKLTKSKSPQLTANVHLRSDAPRPSVSPPVLVDYTHSHYSFSGLKFDKVTLLNEKRYKPYKGVRSQSQAGHFVIRS